MRQEISLVINGDEVWFSEPPQILYNYTLNDTTNPSVVKNSYSKTITIQGVPQNNNIFGQIWNLERIQGSTVSGSYSGAEFNPLQKAEFILFVNGDIYESGYFKLDEVRKKGNDIEYDITLYGGLGEFFYNLTYRKHINGDGSTDDGPDKLELADLDYRTSLDTNEILDLDFTINKDTVASAWSKDDWKWHTINFAPCYNGVPSNLDADKVMINKMSVPTDTGMKFGAFGYNLAQLNEEVTEWETKDLRSYLQRPVIRVKSVIEACCDPKQNGGYEVKLDSHFFDSVNPYWTDAWMTLPMLTEMDIPSKRSQKVTDYSLTKTNKYWEINYGEGVAAQQVKIGIGVGYNADSVPMSGGNAKDLYTTHFYDAKGGFTLQRRFLEWFNYVGGIIVQLCAVDALGNVITTSAPTLLTTEAPDIVKDIFFLQKPSFELIGGKFGEVNGIHTKTSPNNVSYGKFVYKNGMYRWCDMNGNELTLNFSLSTEKPFSGLILKVANSYYWEDRYHVSGKQQEGLSPNVAKMRLYHEQHSHSNSWLGIEDTEAKDSVNGNVFYSIKSLDMETFNYEGFFSGTEIKKKDLLTLGITPCDFLLSYCKLFGLYFYKEPDEKIIHIMDRSTFFTEEVVDLNDLIDRSKEMKITPQLPATRWYIFNTEQVESECNNQHKKETGVDYGLQKVNTNYNFDAEQTDVFADNIFKGGVDVLEYSKYYQQSKYNYKSVTTGDDATIDVQPTVTRMKSYKTYDAQGNEIEMTVPVVDEFGDPVYGKNKKGKDVLQYTQVSDIPNPFKPIGELPLNSDYEGYDKIIKPQFHTEDNSASDGAFVLLFEHGWTDLDEYSNYWLTDDFDKMYAINENPCWLMTDREYDMYGNVIARKVSAIPKYTRNLIYNATHYMTHSWDFGQPQRTYIPDVYTTDNMSIYDKVWKNYIGDMYSVNNRLLKCYCLITDRPNPNWLRRYYWFDNAIWRLNRITDWNISSYDTTGMEFIKVQDMNNYQVEKLYTGPTIDLYLRDYEPYKTEENFDTNTIIRYYNIPANVGTINFNVYIQNGGGWAFNEDGDYLLRVEYEDGYEEIYDNAVNPDMGIGSTEGVISIGRNTRNFKRQFELLLSMENMLRHKIVVEQNSDGVLNAQLVKNNIPTDTIDSQASSGSYWFNVDSSSEWDVEIWGDWIQIQSKTDTRLTLDIQENPTRAGRMGIVIFTNSQGYRIEKRFTQRGAARVPIFYRGDNYTHTGKANYEVGEDARIEFYGAINYRIKSIKCIIQAMGMENEIPATNPMVFTIPSCESITFIVTTEFIPVDSDTIMYTSHDGSVVTPKSNTFGDATVVSNTYRDGVGLIKFNKPLSVIPTESFYSKNLKSIWIPSGVNIGMRAFSYSNLTMFNSSVEGECIIPSGVTLSNYASFEHCGGFTKIVLPEGMTSINNCFYYCLNVTEVSLPSTLTTIDRQAFANWQSIKKIDIPNSVTTIKENAFYNCSSLQELTIPENVVNMGYNSIFYGCSNLKNLYVLAPTAPSITYATFQMIARNGVLHYPTGSDYSQWMSNNDCYLGYYGWTSLPIPPVYDNYRVILNDFPAGQKLTVIQTVANACDLSLPEAKDVVESVPTTLPKRFTYEDARLLRIELVELGCDAEILAY